MHINPESIGSFFALKITGIAESFTKEGKCQLSANER